MRSLGYSAEEYPYWVRSDGCKMLGNYIMVAANLSIRPKGTIVQTSLGAGIVCDTGGFASSNAYQLDIATNW
jgi:3D (Asp-Asp-Asp) domain-containing protein